MQQSPGRHPEEPPGEAGALRRSLNGLSQLTAAAGPEGLRVLLRRVAMLGAEAIPGADGVGITLLEAGRPDIIVASTDFVGEVDAIQYGLGQGPCITAAADRRTVHSAALEDDPDWPVFGPRVATLGVHSVLSLPLVADDSVVGAMNVYAHSRGAFTPEAMRLGEVFAVPAAISVHNAMALFQARRLAEELQSAMKSRSIIDQAIGIIMSRTGVTGAEALSRMRTTSQAQQVKVSVLAQEMVDDAVRRAQSRHSGDTGATDSSSS